MKRSRFDAGIDAAAPSSSGRHQPKISRKVKACQECQSRKIKCGIEPGQARCARCARLSLKCVVNKSLQTLLQGENEWREWMEHHVHSLQTAVAQVQQQLNLPPIAPLQFSSGRAQALAMQTSPSGTSPLHPSDVTAMTRENSPEPETHESPEQALVNAPMASLFEVTKLRNIRSDPGATTQRPAQNREPDFISQGKISLREAEDLFSTFCGTLNAYLWGGIALVHKTLATTRASSALLTAAILAVTALHAQDQGKSFDKCYPIFLDLASQSVFKRYYNLDDVRGLCIGAFWLSDVSWKLSGLAVRIATELKLHQSCYRALQGGGGGSIEDVEKARVWYFLYVCDHHFSIAYGRPPVMHEDATITNHESLLRLPGITQADQRLHSQVGVFIILSRVFHTFGPDRTRLVANDEFEALRRYDIDLARWREHWENRLEPDHHISNYPSKGVTLHYYFARLQLFSVCLRGMNPSSKYLISSERRDFINLAIESASSALRLILDDAELRKAVIGVPLYLLTTIAYASMFLVKVQLHWKQAGFALRGEDVVSLMEKTVTLLDEARHCVRHLAHYIGRGLNSMLQKLKEQEAEAETRQVAPADGQTTTTEVSWAAEEDQGNAWQSTDWTAWACGADMYGYGHVEANVDQDPLYMLDILQAQLPE